MDKISRNSAFCQQDTAAVSVAHCESKSNRSTARNSIYCRQFIYLQLIKESSKIVSLVFKGSHSVRSAIARPTWTDNSEALFDPSIKESAVTIMQARSAMKAKNVGSVTLDGVFNIAFLSLGDMGNLLLCDLVFLEPLVVAKLAA